MASHNSSARCGIIGLTMMIKDSTASFNAQASLASLALKLPILFESSRSDSGEQKREPRTLPSEDEKAALLAEAQAMVERARAVEAERQGVSTS